mmetsp:Transcript_95460/g.269794  ORF Transcript_95460/g.269794 Transcript_95460/m.269794 type:complete len:149 (+) Transcript_95460:53-499(+)
MAGGAETVQVDLGGWVESVYMDEYGPKVLHLDGRLSTFSHSPEFFSAGFHPGDHAGRPWSKLTSTERNILLNLVAKKNAAMKERLEQEGRQAVEDYDGTAPAAGARASRGPQGLQRRPPWFTGLLVEEKATANRGLGGTNHWWNGQPV